MFGILLTMERAEVSINIQVKRQFTSRMDNHPFVSGPVEVSNDHLDVRCMRLFQMSIKSTNLAHSKCNVRLTVAGQIKEHLNH